MIDFPSNPIPGESRVTEGRKEWLCVGLDADGRGIWDLTSTPDQAAEDALAAKEAAEEAQRLAEIAADEAQDAMLSAQAIMRNYATLAQALADATLLNGMRFFVRAQVPEFSAGYEMERTATGAKYITQHLLGVQARQITYIRSLRGTVTPTVPGALFDLWGSDGWEWDGRLIPNRVATVKPTLNWEFHPFNPPDEIGATPVREPSTPALPDNTVPPGNRAQKITSGAQGQFLTSYRSTYGAITATDLRVRVEHQQISGNNQWRFGLASTSTGALISSTVGAWNVAEAAVNAYAGAADMGFGSATGNTDGVIVIQNFAVYDALAGESASLPTATQELAAQMAGHLKRCMARPGAFSLTPEGGIKFSGFPATVTLDPSGLLLTNGYTIGGLFSVTAEAGVSTTGLIAMGFDSHPFITDGASGTGTGQFGYYGNNASAYRIGRLFVNPIISAVASSPTSMHYFPQQGFIFFAMSMKPNADGVTATQTYYINGIPWVNSTGAAWNSASPPKAARLMMGAWSTTGERVKLANPWGPGEMTGMFMYPRALTQVEIDQRQRYMIENFRLDGGTMGLRKAYFIFEGDSLTAFSPAWDWRLAECTALNPRIQAGNVARGGTDIGAGRDPARKQPMLDKIKAAKAAGYGKVVVVMRWGTNEIIGTDPWSWINNKYSHVIWRDQYYLPLCAEYIAAGAEVWHVTMPPRLGLGVSAGEEVQIDLMIQRANDDFRNNWKAYGFGQLIDLGLGTERMTAVGTFVPETIPGGMVMMNWRAANASRTDGTIGAKPHAVSGTLTLSAAHGTAITAIALPGTFQWHDLHRRITAVGSTGYGRIYSINVDGSQALLDTTDVIPTPWPGEPALVSTAHRHNRGGGYNTTLYTEGNWSIVACPEEWQTDGIHQNMLGGRRECDKAYPLVQAFHDTLSGSVE